MHKHPKYSEVFIVLEGALAFFVFDREGGSPVCHVLSSTSASSKRAIVVEADEWHAMTAAPAELGTQQNACDSLLPHGYSYAVSVSTPPSLLKMNKSDLLLNYSGYSGHAVIFEVSSHLYNAEVQTKQLAPFAPIVNRGLDGDPKYFKDTLLPLCARASSSIV